MTYPIGIDSDSTAARGILLESNVIERYLLCLAPFRPTEATMQVQGTLQTGLDARPFLTLTGYGRQFVDYTDKQVTRISRYGLEARLLAPYTRTVIDIDGQDSKATQLDDDSSLSDFLMNDECTVGTGRFLEVISRTLGTSAGRLDAIIAGVEPHVITSMYMVFAGSEVINLRSAGAASETILAGAINAMIRCSANFIGRLSGQIPLLFAGEVSHCYASARMLEGHIGIPVHAHPDAQFVEAIGAALIGQRQGKRK